MLVLQGVTAGYGGTTVLRDVDLTVPDSSVVALLGPNGAGKTTLLRVASGLLAPWKGRLLIDGEDVTGRPPHELAGRGVCHVPEGRGVFPPLTVAQNLELFSPPGQERESRDRAVEAFPILGDRLNQVAGTMSGGQQQMLALARSYVTNPHVVLLDEVSMGLAPIIVDEIFEFLERMAKQGTALLLVEQYATKALAIADYVYILGRGSVTFAGDAAELEGEDVFQRYLGIDVAAVTS
ncbi:MAG: branched-chain amino acid transport system ATP-binding protein [Actinomycetota bacterium]|jgi:branched-chain amino acid transport system ATP-binding protein|nr:branched-chain amino acid transport system ATP-binding protein [Actinomycetota bacterium]MDQ1507682.1 branched-chain amino acid transport system ATP-binding protein [Actinomycetota bacterium]